MEVGRSDSEVSAEVVDISYVKYNDGFILGVSRLGSRGVSWDERR